MLPSNIKICVAIIVSTLIAQVTTGAAQTISTFAGNGDVAPFFTGFTFAAKVLKDSQGFLYVVDAGCCVLKVGRSNSMSVVAGNDSLAGTYQGDGGSAVEAGLNSPTGAFVDSSGALYIADTGNNVIRKVTADGKITTIAGSGIAGYAGDGDLATRAKLHSPNDVVVDGNGRVYISDYANHRIRMIDATGVITTIAGTGVPGFTGDGHAAINAQLNYPSLMDIDGAGNIYIADRSNNRVRELKTNGTLVTVAGNGIAGYSGDGGSATSAELNLPTGVSVDSGGNLYIGDFLNARIRRVAANGTISTVAGNGAYADEGGSYSGDYGPAADAGLSDVPSAVMGLDGNLYISDFRYVRQVLANKTIFTLMGNGAGNVQGDGGNALAATFNIPAAVAVDEMGNVFVADSFDNRVRKVSTDGIITTIAGIGISGIGGDGGPAVDAPLSAPDGIAFDKNGNVLIADGGNQCVHKVTANGAIEKLAGVCGYGGYDGDGADAALAHLSFPTGVAVDKNGNVFISDNQNKVIRKVSASGIISTFVRSGLIDPHGLAVDAAGNLYIADGNGRDVLEVSPAGVVSRAWTFGRPYAVSVDSKSGSIYVADNTSLVYRISADGTVSIFAGVPNESGYTGDGGLATSADLNGPGGIALDASGNLYIADSGNQVIRKVSQSVNLDQHGLTGSWFNPATGGQGFELEVYPDVFGLGQGLMFAGWFTYDATAAGGRRWYALQGAVSDLGPVATLQIFDVEGGNLNAAPSLGGNGPLGQATIQFSDCNTGSLTYTFTDGSGRSGTIPIVRLTPNVTCSPSGDNGNLPMDYLLSGNWFNPATSGQGLIFDFSPSINNLFAAWYTFLPNGQQLGGAASQDWFTLQAQFVSGNTSLANIPIVETTGGAFNDPTSTSSVQVGTASIAFQSCTAMTLSYQFTGGTNTGLHGTIDLQRVGPAPAGCSL